MQLADHIRKARQIQNKLSHPSCAAVIVAAGSSARMGGTDKLLAELGGLPVLSRTLRVFDDHEMIDTIIVVAREDRMPKISRVCSPYRKVRIVVPGGESRQESVMHGLKAVPEGTELVAVHDGARPLVEQRVIEETIQKAYQCAAAAPPGTGRRQTARAAARPPHAGRLSAGRAGAGGARRARATAGRPAVRRNNRGACFSNREESWRASVCVLLQAYHIFLFRASFTIHLVLIIYHYTFGLVRGVRFLAPDGQPAGECPAPLRRLCARSRFSVPPQCHTAAQGAAGYPPAAGFSSRTPPRQSSATAAAPRLCFPLCVDRRAAAW